MMRLLPSLVFALLLVALPAAAQSPRAGQSAPAAPAATQAPPTRAQARVALEVLRDDAKRAQLITVLEAIARAPQPAAPQAAASQPAAPQPAASATPAAGATPTPEGGTPAAPAADSSALPLPLVPDSVGAQVLTGITQHLSQLSDALMTHAREIGDFPLLGQWAVRFALDPDRQAQALDVGWRLAVMLLIGLGIELGARRGLRRPAEILAAKAPPGSPPPSRDADSQEAAEEGQTEKLLRRLPTLLLLRRLPLALGRFCLELLPILAFLAACYVVVGSQLADGYTVRLVMLGVAHAYAGWRGLVALVRLLVAPGLPQLRLIRVSEEGALYLLHWTRRIAALAVFGYAAAEIGLLFGLYWIAYEALMKLIGLGVTGCLVVVIAQSRGAVAARLRVGAEDTRALARLRNRLAGIWHILAIFYLIALWGVWALDIPDGFGRLLRVVAAAAIIGTLARMLTVLAQSAFDRALSFSPETTLEHPGLEARIRAYQPIGRVLIAVLITAVALVTLAEAWGVDAFSWFTNDSLGERIVGALTTIGVTLVFALLVWELANAGMQRHLERLSHDQAARSARLRTLLPMLRTTLFGGICIVAGLMILSEIGVNIAPLLAGAGVIGLAIGFGSQKLVQDIITGLFLLLENAMQVGDVVSLGGLSGTVENLSIRTIRLRALDGSVHIIPFSAVTTVTNQTRDFGYAVVDVSIGYNEDPVHVGKVLREVAQEMRAEPRWHHAIRDDLDVMGVDKFLDSALVLRTRLKTTPAQRWAVARELNLRIKARFDELAIDSPWTSHRVPDTEPPPPPAAEPEGVGGHG